MSPFGVIAPKKEQKSGSVKSSSSVGSSPTSGTTATKKKLKYSRRKVRRVIHFLTSRGYGMTGCKAATDCDADEIFEMLETMYKVKK